MFLFSTQELLRTKEKLSAERDNFLKELEQVQQQLVESKNRIREIEHSIEETNKERILVRETTSPSTGNIGYVASGSHS